MFCVPQRKGYRMANDFRFLMYNSPEEDVSINAVVKDETIWLSQKAMAELFDCSPDNISLHLKNIYSDGELSEKATAEDFSVVQQEGKRNVTRNIRFYNLDAIISVGYRVNSRRATHFRIWATSILKEYMIKGFVLDDDRLKQGKTAFGKDYFKELLERVRSIRASERRIWQQITDILLNAVSTMTRTIPLHMISMPWSKTNSTSPSPARPLQKSFTPEPTMKRIIWA